MQQNSALCAYWLCGLAWPLSFLKEEGIWIRSYSTELTCVYWLLCLVAVTEQQTKVTEGREDLLGLILWRYSPSWRGSHDCQSTRRPLTLHPQSASRRRWRLVFGLLSFFFHLDLLQGHEKLLPTLWMSFLNSVNLIQVLPQRNTKIHIHCDSPSHQGMMRWKTMQSTLNTNLTRR